MQRVAEEVCLGQQRSRERQKCKERDDAGAAPEQAIGKQRREKRSEHRMVTRVYLEAAGAQILSALRCAGRLDG